MKPSKTVQPWEPITPNHINITITSLLQSHQHQKKYSKSIFGYPPRKKEIKIKFQGYHDWPSAASPLPPRLGATLARCCLSIPQIDRLKAWSEPGWRSDPPEPTGMSFPGGGETSKDRTLRQAELDGGFNIFYFHPENWGKMNPIWRFAYFSDGVGKKPPTSKLFWVCFGGFKFWKPSGEGVWMSKGLWKEGTFGLEGKLLFGPKNNWSQDCVDRSSFNHFCWDLFWMCGCSYEFGAKYQAAINLQL